MKKRMKRILLLLIVAMVLAGGVALALALENRTNISNKPFNVIELNDDVALDIDKMPHDDVNNLMRQIVDDEGNFVENHGILHQNYVSEMDRFRILSEEGKLVEVGGKPFVVNLHSSGEGNFEYIFYSVETNGKLVAIPSEWSVMAFLFLFNEEADKFFACTDTGIYKIDPIMQTATVITSNTYNGKSYDELFLNYVESGGWHLSWIGNPVLSPDGLIIAFQSNRNDENSLPSSRESLWIINTDTYEERLVIVDDKYTQVPQGFIGQNTLLVKNIGANDDDNSISLVTVDIQR
ncbi:MAG: hypothetical protein LBC73_01655 [Oscillospiraceae bacterium]|nr:hypothetical protein [Oscillospiraceae bacterium]